MKKNDLLKFITCGSVDDGKSTLIGHILYDAKLLYADQEQALMLESQVGSRSGKIDYSLLLDGLTAEREQGITIDVAYRYFTTSVRSFIAADTPGHEEYTRNMAVGASFADLAVILIDASKGILSQTRRHARICSLMGIKFFVFAVNKMDLIQYDQTVFDNISLEIRELSNSLKLENIIIIPVSASEGDNITKYSPQMLWYNGPHLLEYLENADVHDNLNQESGFYMPIQRVCRPDMFFRGFQGQIESGCINVADIVQVLPSGEKTAVKSIYTPSGKSSSAYKGQPVTIQLETEVDISRGCVIAKDADLKLSKEFTADLLWMDDVKLTPGCNYWLKSGTKIIPAVVSELISKTDINSGDIIYNIESASKNELVQCVILTSEPIVIDKFLSHKTLGELILIDRISNATSACGTVGSFNIYNQSKYILDDVPYNGVFLNDGVTNLKIYLFDQFYYHPELHTVLAHKYPTVTYDKGSVLPLNTDEFSYPLDFDIVAQNNTANIRNGIFVGFGDRDSRHEALDVNGIDMNYPQNFYKYRRITVKP